jgi:D-apionolactonase
MSDAMPPNGLGPFYCEGIEILRRLFVTVRDSHWNETPPLEWNCNLNGPDNVTSIRARHVSDLVDFEWRGTLKVSSGGRELQFAFEGEALRDMDVCRLGLVVLHPVETMLGARIEAVSPDTQQTLTVASLIAPQPIAEGIPLAMTQPFSTLKIERADLCLLEFAFSGDLFELEDQRNWGDASFKSYCTPLRLGFPRPVKRGSRIAQRLVLRFTPPVPAVNLAVRPIGPVSGVFPNIGCARGIAVTSSLHQLAWHHVHVDLCEGEDPEELLTSPDQAVPYLEIGVEGSYFDDRWPDVVAWISGNCSRVARLLVYGSNRSPPSAASIESWRRVFDSAGVVDLPIFAATRGYFVELNRAAHSRPEYPIGMAFPLTCTVHSDDARTIAENAVAIRDIADTARHMTRSSSLAIVPLALYYPLRPASARFPSAMVAPWLAATMLQAAAANVGSVTLAMDVCNAAPKELIAHLLGCAGQAVTLVGGQSSDVHCALIAWPGRRAAQILGVNLGLAASSIDLMSMPQRIRSLVEIIDGHSVDVDACIEVEARGVRWLRCELVTGGN